jgi:putative nucleotidyltransferase with HDIG domain
MDSSEPQSQFVSVSLHDVLVGELLPCSIYVYLNFRFITFRSQGDTIDRTAYDRLEFKKVKNLFVSERDRPSFEAWISTKRAAEPRVEYKPEHQKFREVREDVHRKMLDIFQSNHPDRIIAQTLSESRKLVDEVIKVPYAVKSLAMLQNYSRGTVDHSVNVSVLSVYLAMQMGYSHNLILQHVGTGGLLHDLGKPRVDLDDSDKPEEVAEKMKQHPVLGLKFLESQSQVPNEVKLIVSQHHECHDGTGYPKKLRGSGIYDLARIVSIANVFDEIVGEGHGTLIERQRAAIVQLDQVLYKKFDPQKLEKALKILKLGV